MLSKRLFVVLAVLGAVLGVAAEARAWGAMHVGYTHVGPSGVYHAGRTEAVGPYGAYSGGHAFGATSYGGAAHYGYGYGAHYDTQYHGGSYGYAGGSYHYGGFRYGGSYSEAGRAGVYRY